MRPSPLLAAATLALALPASAQTAAERLDLPEPSAREGRTVSVNGAEIFVRDTGEGDVVMLLHGYPLSGALFERVRDALDDGHRVVTIDHRGYGASSAPGVVEEVATYAEDALAVMAELGIEEAAIGGMSMGGPIAFEMYRQDPSVFSAMMLIDTNHMPAGAIETGIWRGVETALGDGGKEAVITFLLPNMLTGETRLVTEPAAADYLQRAMEQSSEDGFLGGARVLAGRPDSTETLEGVEVPVLVIVGREDTLYPVAVAEAMAEAAPEGELVVVPGAAHAAVFEAPAEVARAMEDFLSGM